MKTRAVSAWFALVVLTAASGAQCHRRDVPNPVAYGPRVLTQNPSLADVMQAVNDNSAKIRSLYTTDATLTVPGAPSLRANLALERQKRLRLRAETAITGAELDLGSNDELFWVWVRRNDPSTLFYCRHAQLTGATKQMLPVDPQWLLDAVGLVSIDPAQQHSPPQRNANGRLEIRTLVPGPTGTMTKTTVVDEARAWVMEQHLHDERGTLVASALTNHHWRDPGTGAVVPQEIELRWPATQFSLKLDVRQWTVNAIPADPSQLFAMPSVAGWRVVDLADPNLRMQPPVSQTAPPLTPITLPTAAVPSRSVMGPFFEPPRTTAAGWTPGSPTASPPTSRY